MKFDAILTQPVIETDRMTLRPTRRSDAGLLEMYLSDDRVARGTRSFPHPLPPGAVEALIARAQDDDRREDLWVMDGSSQGHVEVLGLVGLETLDRDQSQISYFVAPAFWNTGFASEAVGAMISANPHDAKTLFADVFQDNPASARVLTNMGFEYIGDAEAFSVARGVSVPTWTYLRVMA